MALNWLTFGLDVVKGLFSGPGNVIQGKREVEAQKAEAEYNLDQLELKEDRLLEAKNENLAKLELSLEQALNEGRQGIWSTSVAQQNNMRASAFSNTENQAIMYSQLASLQRQNLQSVGSAEQAVATSGFRNTGSGANAIAETERVASDTYEQSRRQIQLSAYQGYMQAADSYFASNVQIESYREAMRNAEDNFSIQSEMLESQYQYDLDVLAGEKGYWKGVSDNSTYTFWDGLADFFGGF